MEKAINVLVRGAELFPLDSGILMLLGDIYLRTGKNAEARRTYQKVLKLEPGNEQALKKYIILEDDYNVIYVAVERLS